MKTENQLLEGFELLHENQLLQEFHVEELEKRYEFAWIDSAKVGFTYYGYGASITIY